MDANSVHIWIYWIMNIRLGFNSGAFEVLFINMKMVGTSDGNIISEGSCGNLV